MKVEALPLHRRLAAILGALVLGCYLFALALFRQPLQSVWLVLPLPIFFGIIFLPYYLDHQGVTYELADDAITLWRKGEVRRRIPYADIASVRNWGGAILLRRRGLLGRTELLHPKSSADEIVEHIRQHIRETGEKNQEG